MLKRIIILTLLLTLGCSPLPPEATPTPTPVESKLDVDMLFSMAGGSDEVHTSVLKYIDQTWDNGLVAVFLEMTPLLPKHRVQPLYRVIARHTRKRYQTPNSWYRWYWNQPKRPPVWYPEFKSRLYSRIDPSFAQYFDNKRETLIDLTEVRWGGVKRDGIPPLDHPKMLPASEAKYLEDSNLVFGIIHKGDARAYPKRILAWHEMFRDEIGGDSIAGVYCTLCGTMIPYLAREHILGTSGFLYRSNKLMYDMETRSLWSTTDGKPVVGPLVGKEIQLKSLPVVTTTWGEWKRRHPKTQVLSLQTGFKRDYGEGVAYRDYFSTDELMFNTQALDRRLANKAEVLVLGIPGKPLALDSSYLSQNPVLHEKKGDTDFVVLTDPTGANRVYETQGRTFADYADGRVIDSEGGQWRVGPDQLLGPNGETLPRLPAHRAFWFGWYAAHPETRLVKAP